MEFDPKDINFHAHAPFRLPFRPASCFRGKVWMMTEAHNEQAELLSIIIEGISKQHTQDNQNLIKFELNLSELKPLQDAPGVNMGVLVDFPLIFEKNIQTGTWSCEFPVDAQGVTWTVSGKESKLIEIETISGTLRASELSLEMRSVAFCKLFQLNKALNAYARLMRIPGGGAQLFSPLSLREVEK